MIPMFRARGPLGGSFEYFIYYTNHSSQGYPYTLGYGSLSASGSVNLKGYYSYIDGTKSAPGSSVALTSSNNITFAAQDVVGQLDAFKWSGSAFVPAGSYTLYGSDSNSCLIPSFDKLSTGELIVLGYVYPWASTSNSYGVLRAVSYDSATEVFTELGSLQLESTVSIVYSVRVMAGDKIVVFLRDNSQNKLRVYTYAAGTFTLQSTYAGTVAAVTSSETGYSYTMKAFGSYLGLVIPTSNTYCFLLTGNNLSLVTTSAAVTSSGHALIAPLASEPTVAFYLYARSSATAQAIVRFNTGGTTTVASSLTSAGAAYTPRALQNGQLGFLAIGDQLIIPTLTYSGFSDSQSTRASYMKLDVLPTTGQVGLLHMDNAIRGLPLPANHPLPSSQFFKRMESVPELAVVPSVVRDTAMPRAIHDAIEGAWMFDSELLDSFGTNDWKLTGDPYWDNVVAQLRFDGTSGTQTLTDDTGRTWAVSSINANTSQLLNSVQALGSNVWDQDARGIYTSKVGLDFSAANTPWQFEIRLVPEIDPGVGSASDQAIFSHRVSTDANNYYFCRRLSTRAIHVYAVVGGVVRCDVTTTQLTTNNAVTTIQVGRTEEGLVEVFIGGVKATLTGTNDPGTWPYPDGDFYIGQMFENSDAQAFWGKYDEVRITNINRYAGFNATSTYTVGAASMYYDSKYRTSAQTAVNFEQIDTPVSGNWRAGRSSTYYLTANPSAALETGSWTVVMKVMPASFTQPWFLAKRLANGDIGTFIGWNTNGNVGANTLGAVQGDLVFSDNAGPFAVGPNGAYGTNRSFKLIATYDGTTLKIYNGKNLAASKVVSLPTPTASSLFMELGYHINTQFPTNTGFEYLYILDTAIGQTEVNYLNDVRNVTFETLCVDSGVRTLARYVLDNTVDGYNGSVLDGDYTDLSSEAQTYLANGGSPLTYLNVLRDAGWFRGSNRVWCEYSAAIGRFAFSRNHKTVTHTSADTSAWANVRSRTSFNASKQYSGDPTTGVLKKRYFEVRVESVSGYQGVIGVVGNGGNATNFYPGQDAISGRHGGLMLDNLSGACEFHDYLQGTFSTVACSPSTPVQAGDIVGIEIDQVNLLATWYVNNVQVVQRPLQNTQLNWYPLVAAKGNGHSFTLCMSSKDMTHWPRTGFETFLVD